MVLLITVILFEGGPPTIRWFVIAIIVDAIYLHALFRDSHVGNEVIELMPAVTDLYSTASVMRPSY